MSNSNNPLKKTDCKSHESRNDVAEARASVHENAFADKSLNETEAFTIRVELPMVDYAALAKRAAQVGETPEQLIAQAVGKMLV